MKPLILRLFVLGIMPILFFSSCNLLEDLTEKEEPFYQGTGTVTDIDGNEYGTVHLGDQWWMAENLRTTTYANGSAIPLAETDSAWEAQGYTGGAYCYYNNNYEEYGSFYGAMYNWQAAMNGASASDLNPSSVRGVCPSGWHIPSREEWTELIENVAADGNEGNEGVALKHRGKWQRNNGKNTYSFTALPGGFRTPTGDFVERLTLGYWWTASDSTNTAAFERDMYYHHTDVHEGFEDKRNGYYVRCVKD